MTENRAKMWKNSAEETENGIIVGPKTVQKNIVKNVFINFCVSVVT